MKFYNREKEVKYLKTYVQLEPNSILFVYGPKSSGKTTVMLRVIEELSKRDDLVFFYYDLRNFDFNNLSLNDVFAKINESINAVVKDGKKPILIIDELQKLKNIYFNGGKSLLNELFNLFVHLTKVRHLCHVICLTSDTLFVEEIYTNSSLENTSKYYLIDWLEKETIKKILKEEGFSEDEANYSSNYLSLPYEIVDLIENKKLGLSVEETIKQWINIEKDKIRYIIRENLNKKDEILKILSKFIEDVKIKNEDVEDELFKTLKILIENEVLFFDVANGIIKPTSIKKWWAIKEVIN